MPFYIEKRDPTNLFAKLIYSSKWSRSKKISQGSWVCFYGTRISEAIAEFHKQLNVYPKQIRINEKDKYLLDEELPSYPKNVKVKINNFEKDNIRIVPNSIGMR